MPRSLKNYLPEHVTDLFIGSYDMPICQKYHTAKWSPLLKKGFVAAATATAATTY